MKRQLSPYTAPAGTYISVTHTPSLWQQFSTYCERQDRTNYIFWAALSVAVQACVLSPLALWSISANHLNDGFLLIAVTSIFAVVIPNLSALSTKVIIPIFSASIVLHLLIVLFGLMG